MSLRKPSRLGGGSPRTAKIAWRSARVRLTTGERSVRAMRSFRESALCRRASASRVRVARTYDPIRRLEVHEDRLLLRELLGRVDSNRHRLEVTEVSVCSDDLHLGAAPHVSAQPRESPDLVKVVVRLHRCSTAERTYPSRLCSRTEVPARHETLDIASSLSHPM